MYSQGIASCDKVLEKVIDALDQCQTMQPPLNLLIARDNDHIRRKAEASMRR